MKPISVLAVDDEPGIALLCKRILSRADYDVTSETDPRVAIEDLQEKHFDLLLVDIRMPEVDGFDVISRAQMVQPDIAVLVMTGFGTVETAIRALRQGVDGLLLKPFNTSEELLQAVRQALADNQRKRDTARVSALRPLFNVTETLFAETDRDQLLELIVSAIREHLHCSNVAYYEVKNGHVAVIAQRGNVLQVEGSNFAAQLISQVDADGNPIIINATGPGDADAQALLSTLGLGAAILIPVTRSNLHSVPLQSVQNCLHLAGREDLEPEKRKEYFELAKNELERLMKTMQRMLDFYRPGAAKVEQVDVLELLQHVLSLTSQQLGQRHIEVKAGLPESLLKIYAVSSQIQQIFFNLILNSMDAMPAGGELRISARSLEHGIEITVHDTGPGIPENHRNDIFEPFFSTKEGGTGLGLTVSYNIVTAHGGTLDLVNGNEPGACFRLFLPVGDKQ